MSLRERQRLQVRADIQRAAFDLFARDGFEDVTTEQIGGGSGGCRRVRTFGHVRNKEDLLLDPVRQGGAGIVTLLEDRPPTESADLAISRAILERSNAFESAEIDQWRSAFRTAPHLMDRVALIAPEHRDRLVELVAQRMQLDPENDSRPGLLVHLMLAAAEFGYRQWIRNPHKRGASLPVCVEGALDAVRGSRWHAQDEDDTKGRDQ